MAGVPFPAVSKRLSNRSPRNAFFPRARQSNVLLRVDLFGCASVDAAHEYLIEALSKFQSATINRRTDTKIGDVIFGTDTVVLFSRANVVVLVRNAEREVVTVTEVAPAIDEVMIKLLR